MIVASAPRLGTRLAVRGEAAAGTFAVALWLGRPLRPMPRGAGCALTGDFAVLADAFPLHSPQFVRALPIPPANALLGTEWTLQAVLALPRGPELTHGVHLRLGR